MEKMRDFSDKKHVKGTKRTRRVPAERAERTYMHRGYRIGMDIPTIADLVELSEDEIKALQ